MKALRLAIAAAFALAPLAVSAEILVLLNYESKPGAANPRDGLAVIDVDPKSKTFGKLVEDIPLPTGLDVHHIVYNQDAGKAYLTALGSNPLQVMEMRPPYRLQPIAIPDCQASEDLVLSEDQRTWYLTCMGSSTIIVGDAQTDRPLKTLASADPNAFIRYPHGIGLHDGIDRILATSTVRFADLGDPGETVSVIEASSGKVLSVHKTSLQPSPSGTAPVEAVFLPQANPPLAYITNMFGNTLWTAAWNTAGKTFSFQQVYDFNPAKLGVPLEIYFNKRHDRLYVTTAKPGHLHVFDISQSPQQPKLIQSIPTAAGAHHVAFSPDERYAFVQNNLLGLPEMSDGSISVIDLQTFQPIANINTLKSQDLNPSSIVLMPKWYREAEQ